MGCVYSNNGSSKKKSNKANGTNHNIQQNGQTSNSLDDSTKYNGTNSSESVTISSSINNNNSNQTPNGTAQCRIFDVEVCNSDNASTAIFGKLEITNTSLIYKLKGRAPLMWPLKYLRSYGCDKDIFSFECGRRCPTGPGVYVFRCARADVLFKIFSDMINNASNMNTSNTAINQLPLTSPSTHGGNIHEYQNMPSRENEHGNFGTLPTRIAHVEHMMTRPHSSLGTEQASHTYLNQSGHNVIGAKSQPNYYTSNPMTSGSSNYLDCSKHSLNGTLHRMTANSVGGLNNSYDSSTLPVSRHHDNSNSEQHLYENHEIPSAVNLPIRKQSAKGATAEDLSYINLDLDMRDTRNIPQGCKNKPTRTTSESQSYIQLDLQSDRSRNNPKISPESGSTSIQRVAQSPSSSNTPAGENSSNRMQNDPNKPNTSVPYAQIDFTKTLALSNSAADRNHRKL